MNKYPFRIVTEGCGDDESIQSDDVVIYDVTPHEAWAVIGKLLMHMAEHDRVLLSITLLA